MSHRHHPPTWHLFVLAAALLFCGGGLHETSAQLVGPLESGVSRPNRPPNPKPNLNHIPGKRPDAKQQAIEQAIKQGNQARDVNDYGRALAHYQKAQQLNPQEARIYYGLGNLYYDLSCTGSAIEAYRRALELKQDYLDALVTLGYAYAVEERYDQAGEQFQKALLLSKDNILSHLGEALIYAKKGKYKEAITLLNKIKAHSKEEQSMVHFALGEVYTAGQVNWQEASAQYEEAIRLNPGLGAGYMKLGLAQLTSVSSRIDFTNLKSVSTQDLEKLIAAAKQATNNIKLGIEHNYNHPIVYIYLATAMAFQLSYQEAANQIKVYFERVKDLNVKLSSLPSKCDSGFNYLNAQGHAFLGLVYLFEGKFETHKKNELFNEVVEHADRAIKLKQDFALPYILLGSVNVERQNYEEAIRQIKKSILYSAAGAEKADAYGNIGAVYFKWEHYPEALENLQEAIKINPNKVAFYYMLARIYVAKGIYEEAIKQYQTASALVQGDPDKADIYREIGALYARLARYPEAIASLQESIKLNPNKPLPYQDLGGIYVMQNKLEEAIEPLKKAIELEAKVATLETFVGLASGYMGRYLKKGTKEDLDEAIRLLKKAIELKPDFATAHFLLGAAYKGLSRADEALASLKKAAQYDPKNPLMYTAMASVYHELKHDDDAAIELLKQAIALKPDHAEAYLGLGLRYQHKNNNAEAIKQMLKAIEINQKYLRAHLELASIYRAQKNYPEAIKHLTTAIEIAPTDSVPYKEMAKVYEEQQKNGEAVRYYEEALNRLKADDLYAKNLYLGRIARLQGRYDEAISSFQKLQPPPSETAGRIQYEMGLTYVASENRTAALAQHQQLVQMKSPLAEELLKKIKEVK